MDGSQMGESNSLALLQTADMTRVRRIANGAERSLRQNAGKLAGACERIAFATSFVNPVNRTRGAEARAGSDQE